MKNKAFTLAEVIITLGIIGIIIAMTLPALIQKHKNKTVEIRLKRFYSIINQAINITESRYGNKQYWFEDLSMEDAKKWFEIYLEPNLNVIRKELNNDGSYIVYFNDGSALKSQKNTTSDWFYYPVNPEKCIDKYGLNGGYGICCFAFAFHPIEGDTRWEKHYGKGIEPYKYRWNGTDEQLMEGSIYSCKTGNQFYCTTIIQRNNWTIPKNYPQKISY